MRASTTTGLHFAISVVATLALSSIALSVLQPSQDDPLGLSAPGNLRFLLLPTAALTAFTWFVTSLGARLAGDAPEVSPLHSVLGGVVFAGLILLVAWAVPDIRLLLVLLPIGSFLSGFLLIRSVRPRAAV